ncbi:LOW QUALITY PROTEIN: calnexin [Drosophila sechellia]|uniref:LOW QUALITY PROTEIN: calnexin n=1 Tax=Drosophila sechellia TaxID=7238 RepID=UPI0013DE08C2|nr:LOW QUALITY PROTEIN: calnexin [Drosophila sechellia]
MAWKIGGNRAATLSMLLASSLLLLSAVKVTDSSPEYDDFEDDEMLAYESPVIDAKKFHFADHFDDVEASRKRWVLSEAKNDDIAEEISKYDDIWNWEPPQRMVWANDLGLVLKSKVKHAAIAAPLQKPFEFKSKKPLVVQYEVTVQKGQECVGSYLKLLSIGNDTEQVKGFNDKTPYTIMFGPDKCGKDVKMHFIFQHLNGTITEKHCNKPNNSLEELFKDNLPHLYQLVVRPDNSFEIRVDHKIIKEGSLLTDFKPPVNPPAEIDDPNDHKPDSWDEREKIPDHNVHKPEDWDENATIQLPDAEMIFDPTATKPEDWDTEIDGEWKAPLVGNPVCKKAQSCGTIRNPNYKGKWIAPMIDNPNYQGKWTPRKIANPDFFVDLKPFQMTPISAVGLELWSMSSDILFDNLIITDDVEVARDFAANSFDIKRRYIDLEWNSIVNKVVELVKANPSSPAIGLLAIVALVALTIWCGSGTAKVQDSDAKKADAEAKKTDDHQPDYVPIPLKEDEQSPEKDAGDTTKKSIQLSATPQEEPKVEGGEEPKLFLR